MPERDWTRPKPRVVITFRIRSEYLQALIDFFNELRADPKFSGIQRYDILEHLLRPLLTAEGRKKIRKELLER